MKKTGLLLFLFILFAESYSVAPVNSVFFASEKDGVGGIENIRISPNPFSTTFKLEFELTAAANVRIEIFNLIGEKVKAVESAYLGAGEYDYAISVSPKGVYILRMDIDGEIKNFKLINH
jgi:hypothetical protein